MTQHLYAVHLTDLYLFIESAEQRIESRIGDLAYVPSIDLSVLRPCPLTTPSEYIYIERERERGGGTGDLGRVGRAIERIIPRPRTLYSYKEGGVRLYAFIHAYILPRRIGHKLYYIN
jgi:hypothetical protein